jgi:ENTH domain
MEGKHDNRFTIGVALIKPQGLSFKQVITALQPLPEDLFSYPNWQPLRKMQHFGKGALRIAKNYTKGYSDTQAKVRDATSNDAWGPSGTQMNEIAQMTYNQLVSSSTCLWPYVTHITLQSRFCGDYGDAG